MAATRVSAVHILTVWNRSPQKAVRFTTEQGARSAASPAEAVADSEVVSSSVWNRDESEQEVFVRVLAAGAVFLNGMTVSHPELPLGGIKDSGHGRELAAVGIRESCNLKTLGMA